MEGDIGLDLYLVWWLEMCLLKPSLKCMPWLSKHKSGTCIMKRKVNSQSLPYNTINAQPSTPSAVRQREFGLLGGELGEQRPLKQKSPLPFHLWEGFWKDKTWWAAVHGVTRVGHDWVTSLSLFSFMHWRRKWQPTPVFLPGESQGRGSLVGCCLWGRTE